MVSARLRKLPQDPVAGGFDERDAFENLRLRLLAKPLQSSDQAGFSGFAEIEEAFDLQGVVEGLDLLGAEPGDPQERDEPDGGGLLEFVEGRELAGGCKLDDLLI